VPFRVQVTHVAGRLSGARRAVLARRVRGMLAVYVDAAFLRSDYPATRLSGVARPFARALAPDVRRDRTLLTNAALAPSTRSVRSTRRTAYLSVLAPHGSPSGATAAVHLVFLVDRGDRRAQRVDLSGRLLLSPDASHRWRIFGYELHRSQRPARTAS
jgi:hypothetical protein